MGGRMGGRVEGGMEGWRDGGSQRREGVRGRERD